MGLSSCSNYWKFKDHSCEKLLSHTIIELHVHDSTTKHSIQFCHSLYTFLFNSKIRGRKRTKWLDSRWNPNCLDLICWVKDEPLIWVCSFVFFFFVFILCRLDPMVVLFVYAQFYSLFFSSSFFLMSNILLWFYLHLFVFTLLVSFTVRISYI